MPGWLIGLLVAVLAYALLVAALLLAGRGEDARALVAFVPDCLVLLRRLAGDPRVPRWGKAMLGMLALYLASPIDLVPDFLPVAGQIDDVVILAIVLRIVLRAAGPDPVREHWPGSPRALDLVLRVAFGQRRAGQSS